MSSYSPETSAPRPADQDYQTTAQEQPGRTQDFVSLDDGGEFRYHASKVSLLEDFEYPAEAICILDRNGLSYGLIFDQEHRLALGCARGQIDFPWLRQSWLRAQKLRPQSYPLHRLPPASAVSLLNGMFEALQLEASPCPQPHSWTVRLAGSVQHLNSLAELDQALAEQEELEEVLVQDAFGHSYHPRRHQMHRFLAPAAGFISYEEGTRDQ
ncbi:hypothetical protein FHU41_000543 [Psychromicrobium silvestre]|uniref:Uncharacterized protein n=1 Tax=Psychromicrobium silvestre TaxID=1645614 RepID=A0A7Y9LRL5_9MICC|nr:hypothetical protein [Psychromicrobium silvestre]NYE94322.1 hypothetical protein [Psychromicrobium silvestre]